MADPPPLILASQSPRRRELLASAGYVFRVVVPQAEAEDALADGEEPRHYVARQARQKAADVAQRIDLGLVLACDTVAECNGQILGKPRDQDEARAMLVRLRGREHHVYSGLCLQRVPDGQADVRTAVTRLKMDPLSEADIDDYLATGGWRGKAGAFGYQDRLGWVHILSGGPSNVVGLPMELLADMLADAGYPRP